ncbi:MAG: hypothetical protein HY313_05115 [Acidobacteria bacterium]|nr:hypothetical protein [Acidobacteriota bacterium]
MKFGATRSKVWVGCWLFAWIAFLPLWLALFSLHSQKVASPTEAGGYEVQSFQVLAIEKVNTEPKKNLAFYSVTPINLYLSENAEHIEGLIPRRFSLIFLQNARERSPPSSTSRI